MKLKAYKEAYPWFVYVSPFVIPEDDFATSNLNQFKVGTSIEAHEV